MQYFLTLFILIFFQFSHANVQIEQIAPDFNLLNSYGEEVSLSEFKGQTVILEWTNHGCPFVAKHYKTKNMQNTQAEAKKANVIWLSIISSAPGTQGFVGDREANELTKLRSAVPSHVLLDSKGLVGKSYGAKTTPHMYLIDKFGILKYQGAIDDAGGRGFMFKDLSEAKNYILSALDELKKGKKITDSATKPYGCSVKYSS
ncbi:MAG TPA: redoxin domain-containing protein [Gammaproteobacteria bacterium]|jgi:peroxiredoxin|nr:redoxin domain-containing protein [Gammaproteobacteria bacterium]